MKPLLPCKDPKRKQQPITPVHSISPKALFKDGYQTTKSSVHLSWFLHNKLSFYRGRHEIPAALQYLRWRRKRRQYDLL
jgi:hypothetical protein